MMQPTVFLALAGLVSLSTAAPTHLNKRQDTSSCRSGLAFNKEKPDQLDLFPKMWTWNWEAKMSQVKDQAPTYSKPGYEYVPMLHSTNPIFTGPFQDDVLLAQKAGATHIMSFNEPDQTGGGGTRDVIPTVQDAINGHIQHVDKPFKGSGLKIGSPSVTNGGGDDMGLQYLKKFMDGCTDCQIDFICVHWYDDSVKDIEKFKSHLNNAHEMFNKPIWVTEWRAPNNDPELVKQARKFMSDSGFVERESMYSVEKTLLNSDGTALSQIGQQYSS